MENRKGDWIATYSGIKFWPLDPRVEEINIEDIAHALSNVCRFGGHVKEFYSVAQHSVYCSYYVEAKNALAGLLHDAAESYLADICRPIKKFINNFQEIEDNLMEVISKKFGFSIQESYKDVKRVDNILLCTEASDLICDGGLNLSNQVKPLSIKIYPLSPKYAKQSFLKRFKDLYGTY